MSWTPQEQRAFRDLSLKIQGIERWIVAQEAEPLCHCECMAQPQIITIDFSYQPLDPGINYTTELQVNDRFLGDSCDFAKGILVTNDTLFFVQYNANIVPQGEPREGEKVGWEVIAWALGGKLI